MNPFVQFYPVLNGSCVLIKTQSNKTILIDCKITKKSDDPKNQEFFDVKSDLLNHLERDDKDRPFIDLFILTHPDQDHCHGFQNHFFTGKPSVYNKEDAEENMILIDEMWTTKLIYGEDICKDAVPIKDEVVRRRALYSSNDRSTETDFNRLTMIGFDTDENFGDCPYHIPGDLVEDFAGLTHSDIEIFVHSPFKKSLIDSEAESDRNHSSIVCQYRIKRTDSQHYLNLLEGGDADHYRWETIKEKSEKNENTDRLEFDVFSASHHCSWGFYNDRPYGDNKEPKQSSKDLIQNYKNKNSDSYIVASSKEVINDENNPPHYPAKQEYIKDLGKKSYFICTGEHPTKADPKPVRFILEKTGWSKEGTKKTKSSERAATAYSGYKTARSYATK